MKDLKIKMETIAITEEAWMTIDLLTNFFQIKRELFLGGMVMSGISEAMKVIQKIKSGEITMENVGDSMDVSESDKREINEAVIKGKFDDLFNIRF